MTHEGATSSTRLFARKSYWVSSDPRHPFPPFIIQFSLHSSISPSSPASSLTLTSSILPSLPPHFILHPPFSLFPTLFPSPLPLPSFPFNPFPPFPPLWPFSTAPPFLRGSGCVLTYDGSIRERHLAARHWLVVPYNYVSPALTKDR